VVSVGCCNDFSTSGASEGRFASAALAPSVGAPVSGFLGPVNNLTVFAPYLALFGVIAALAIIVWKRPN